MKFDWKFYCNNYPDLIIAGINTERKALSHWHRFGKNEGRIYNKIMLGPDPIINVFNNLLSNIKHYNCPCKKILNHNNFHILWNFLHKQSYKYDLNMKNIMGEIILGLKKIACKECRNHYITYLNTKHLDNILSSRTNCILFFFNLHNEINSRNGKQIYSLEQCNKIY